MGEGFTLMELVVVVAILGLLAGLLVPSFVSARELARQSLCAANLRTLTAGVWAYAQDHDGWLPTAEPPRRQYPDPRHWFLNDELLGHMGVPCRRDTDGMDWPPPESSPLVCPTDDAPGRWSDGTTTGYGLSYAMNGTWGLGGRPDHVARRRLSDFRGAGDSGVMVFMDACGNNTAPGVVLYMGCARDTMRFRHRGRAHAAFLEGAVTTRAPKEVPLGMANRYEPFWSSQKP